MLYLQLHSSLSNMRSICQAYAKLIMPRFPRIGSFQASAVVHVVLEMCPATFGKFQPQVLQNITKSSILLFVFRWNNSEQQKLQLPKSWRYLSILKLSWAGMFWAGQVISDTNWWGVLQESCSMTQWRQRLLEWLLEWPRVYMMYMQYPFVFGCLRNVMSTFGMGITWRDHWHVSAILNQAKWQNCISQCSVVSVSHWNPLDVETHG